MSEIRISDDTVVHLHAAPRSFRSSVAFIGFRIVGGGPTFFDAGTFLTDEQARQIRDELDRLIRLGGKV